MISNTITGTPSNHPIKYLPITVLLFVFATGPVSLQAAYCVFVPDGGVDMDVSGDLPVLSAFDPLVAGAGVEVAPVFESPAGLSFFKTSSTLRPPASISSPTPCMVLHPAKNATVATIATNLGFITASYLFV